MTTISTIIVLFCWCRWYDEGVAVVVKHADGFAVVATVAVAANFVANATAVDVIVVNCKACFNCENFKLNI